MDPSCLTAFDANVSNAFLAAPPVIARTIYDKTLRMPNWVRDMYQVEPFEPGQGTEEQQLIYRGQLPQIERGFDQWRKLNNVSGCEPCEGDGCGYNITQFGGNGLERKLISAMARDFRSPSYCVKDIQTTAHFRQMFAQVVNNLYAQVNFFKEQNIGFNYLTSLAKKYVIDSGGPKPNPENPYVYRPTGTAKISAFNIDMLQIFYEYLRLVPDVVPYDVVNGSPVYAMECSNELLYRLYRDNPTLRQDVRFSGLANDLLVKYNFMSTIQGMYIPAPILYPRRFKLETVGGVAGTPVEIFPTVNGIPMEVGSFSGVNPDYINPDVATHEEVLIHGMYPFKVKFLPTVETLGENTSFGPEFSFMNSWSWINPMTDLDPARRVGYFFTSATIMLAPQYSEGVFGFLVERASAALAFSQNPLPVCPVDEPTCDNEVPEVLCPCPLILTSSVSPVTGNSILTLAVPLDPVPEEDDDINFGLDTGGYVVGTVVAASEDGSAVEVTFPNGTDLGDCDHFTTVWCSNLLACSSRVLSYNRNCTDTTRIDLVLATPIKGDVADTLTMFNGDGTTTNATVISIDMSTNTWVVDLGSTVFCDNVGGIIGICVPTAADSSCPGCDGNTFTQCET